MEAPTIDRPKPRRKERMSYEAYLGLSDELRALYREMARLLVD